MKVITANLLNRFWTNGVKPIKTAVGTISSLTTAAKTNLVAAINEVKAKADSNATAITDVNNNLSSKISTDAIKNNLTTTAAGSVLDARQGKILNDNLNWKITGNWKYLKFESGVLIATLRAATKVIISDPTGSLYFKYLSGFQYPITFIDPPVVYYSYENPVGVWASLMSVGTTTATPQIIYFAPSPLTVDGYSNFLAIGRWK